MASCTSSPANAEPRTRACLKLWMGVAGPTRFLRVVVNRRRAVFRRGLHGFDRHELQHTVEALSEPNTVNSMRLYNYFTRTAISGPRFETMAAITAGDAVRHELRDLHAR